MALYNGDVKSNVVTSTNVVVGSPARVRGIHFTADTSPGSIVIKDGGSGGTTAINIATLANSYGNVVIPGDGVLCYTNVHVTLTNVISATIFYG